VKPALLAPTTTDVNCVAVDPRDVLLVDGKSNTHGGPASIPSEIGLVWRSAYETPPDPVAAMSEQDAMIGGPVE
jgi:hypothetical protein